MYGGGMTTSEIDSSRYPELRKWAVASLAAHKKPNDIIFQLCHRTGWDWNQSKKFLEQVVESDKKEVHQKRMPLLVGIGILMMVLGVVSFLPAFFDLIADLSMLEPPLDLNKVIEAGFLARTEYVRIGRLVIGMAMFVGGGFGIWSAVKSALTGEGEDLMKSGPQK